MRMIAWITLPSLLLGAVPASATPQSEIEVRARIVPAATERGAITAGRSESVLELGLTATREVSGARVHVTLPRGIAAASYEDAFDANLRSRSPLLLLYPVRIGKAGEYRVSITVEVEASTVRSELIVVVRENDGCLRVELETTARSERGEIQHGASRS